MKYKHKLLVLIALLITLSPTLSQATGTGNVDNGGGGMGDATGTDKWTPGADGIRITVVSVNGSVAANSFDLTSFNVPDNIIHFGKVSKIKYKAGTALSPSGSSYACSKPSIELPTIISDGGDTAKITAIKKYFCSEYAAKLVASKTGMAYNCLISGAYKLVIEPIAYFLHGGKYYAMTATEAGLYNQKSGSLRSKMPSLTHQNLPLSLFLEESDLGFTAWKGTTTSKVEDADILKYLGIGIVKYRDLPPIEINAPDVVYRVNTDVITSVTLTTVAEINPDNPATATFKINGTTYTVKNIIIPADSSQIVWVKWHTPSTAKTLNISMSVSGANTGTASFKAKIEALTEKVPPDPKAKDTKPGFTVSAVPSKTQKLSASWSVWDATWQSGRWNFTSLKYTAKLAGTMVLSPDDKVPTASGKTMKSGYGVKQTTTAKLTVNAPSSHYAPAQTATSYFPDFKYQTYWRNLQGNGAANTVFTFKANSYSTYNRKVHFTPVWYPNSKKYTVYTYIIDLWTPVGMLSANVSDYVTIKNSVFDDWYSNRE